MLKSAQNLRLLDVREPEEHALVKLKNSVLIPLMSLESRLNEVRELSASGDNLLIVYCRSGHRSALAIEWLDSQGLRNLKNLRGGINLYAEQADSSLTPY